MILPSLIAIPIVGGLAVWALGRRNSAVARWLVVIALASDLVLLALLWLGSSGRQIHGPWLAEAYWPWIPQFGISFHLAVDGLSLLLLLLTVVMGLLAVVASWSEPAKASPFYYFNVLWVLAGIIGVFLAIDLFLFYLFWELMLVPMFLLFLWGGEKRGPAALKFFIFTQAGGLVMLLAILGLYFSQGQGSGVYTFDYPSLLGARLDATTAFLLLLGFFVGFAVKLPVIPLHTWLPDAYAESPLAATVILSALMAKTGGYGMLRFVLPLFPDAAQAFAPVAMALGVAGILYGAFLAFGQLDLKRLVAYSSLSHMGFVVLGIFALNSLALQGAVLQMIAHGVSVGALFILVSALRERIHTGELFQVALWSSMPRLSSLFLLFAFATLGLPGLGNFAGEFLVLLGAYRASAPLAALAALGVVASAVYALRLLQQAVYVPGKDSVYPSDLSLRETVVLGVLAVAIVWLGLAPQPVLDLSRQALSAHGIYSDSAVPSIPSDAPAARRGADLSTAATPVAERSGGLPGPLRDTVVADVPVRHGADVSLAVVADVPLAVVADVPVRHGADVSLAVVADVSLAVVADVSLAVVADVPVRHAADVPLAVVADVPVRHGAGGDGTRRVADVE